MKPENHTLTFRYLTLALSGIALAWLIFQTGLLLDIVAATKTSIEWSPSTLITVISLVAAALSSLIARAHLNTHSHAGAGAFRITTLTLIVALALSAFAVVTIFTGGFFTSTSSPSTLHRTLDVYLPIVFHTALIVWIILRGFVFHSTPDPAHSRATVPPRSELGTRGPHATAAAYTFPIIAVAVSLLTGLIVYDLTNTTLETWVWVLIATILAIGIAVGTRNANRAELPKGSRGFNSVLTIVFTAVATLMSLTFGATSTDMLRVQPDLSLSVFPTTSSDTTTVPIADSTFSLYGHGLGPGSTAAITLQPAETVIEEIPVSQDGSAYIDTDLSAVCDSETTSIVAEATDSLGENHTVTMPVTVNEGCDTAVFAEGLDQGTSTNEVTLAPLTPEWALRYVLPSFALLILALLTTGYWVRQRSPWDSLTTPSDASFADSGSTSDSA